MPLRRFGETIRAARVAAGLSLRDAAQKAGISEDGLSKIERDVNSPTLATLGRLATVYGQLPGDLLPHHEVESPSMEVLRLEMELYAPLLDALRELGEHERLLMIYTLASQVKTLTMMLERYDRQVGPDGTPKRS
jgi:transcriptional regulator with XRE-family HTH domain